jgi:hypothetical protein
MTKSTITLAAIPRPIRMDILPDSRIKVRLLMIDSIAPLELAQTFLFTKHSYAVRMM